MLNYCEEGVNCFENVTDVNSNRCGELVSHLEGAPAPRAVRRSEHSYMDRKAFKGVSCVNYIGL